MKNRSALGAALCTALLAAAGTATAQNQVVKPPVAQAWIDVATFSGMGMPGMGGAGSANPMAMMGAMMGGGGGANARNAFGNTQTAATGRWVDVTLYTSRNPALAEATQAVPAGTQLAPSLKLVAPQAAPGKPPTDDDVEEHDYERPKGKIYLYWGCGDAVRAGQPRVLDIATAAPQDFQKFFVARRATQRGAHSAAGRPSWPNAVDARMVPDNASLVGETAFSGQGVPENFKFAIGAAQDLMPPIQLRQSAAGGATMLAWNALPTARAYFIAAMGAKEGAQNEMVFWTSSEQPDTGMGLVDYQTNPAVDRWLKEGVLLAPSVTQCSVPKGIFGDGGAAMLRMIAYGSELRLAHPPRPADPKIAWTPDWAVKIRVKSVASAMLGMDMDAMMRGTGAGAPANDAPPPPPQEKQEDGNPLNPANLLKGIFGR
ncbi:MAG: hypothetical protein IAE86_15640 [Burkholderiaceae bacterium]|nr:hypothetical protein [Burkholderiaceae bacterium]